MNEQINLYKALDIEHRVQDIVARQEDTKWKFDVRRAERYIKYLEAKRDVLYSIIRPSLSYNVSVPYQGREVRSPFIKSGAYSSVVRNWFGINDGDGSVGGPFTRVEFEEPNLGSDKQLKEQLFRLGWIPDAWNFKKGKDKKIIYEDGHPIKTSPKLTESSYESLTVGIGPDLALYLKVDMRLSSIKGWLKKTDQDGFISAQADPLGTPTGRHTHKGVVNIPKNDPKVFFGKQCRSLFKCRSGGRVLVGYDISGIEARVGAHYTFELDGGQYARDVLEGDWHIKNARQVYFIKETEGLDDSDKVLKSYRSRGKNGSYCLMYGGKPKKLAETLGIPQRRAQIVFDKFWEVNEGLGKLRLKLKRFWKKYGYIVGLDGRPIFVRKESDLINYLFQSAGSVVHKVAMIIMDAWVKKYNIDAVQVGNFHDEVAFDCDRGQSDLLGQLGVASIRRAGQVLGLNVELDADYMIGKNYAETH